MTFNANKNDIKGTWNTINSIFNKTKKTREYPNTFNHGNSVFNNKQDIATNFNSYFTNIGTNLAEEISTPKDILFSDYLIDDNSNHFEFTAISELDVVKIIDGFVPKNTSGFDGISTKFLKLIKIYISKPIALIINQMFNTGIFPEQLKIAKVVPIFKKGEDNLFTNYRPISLLPSISKIFEKIILKQMVNFFNKHNLLFKSQYGFRSEHSTEMASLELVDRIVQEMDKNNIPITVFLDLSKAFDTLNHKILMHKLNYYGIRNSSLSLLKIILQIENNLYN